MHASKLMIAVLIAGLFVFSCDGDLDPVEDPCKIVTCSGHGQCEAQNGGAVCVCEAGYLAEGLECVEDPCYEETCSGHGQCVVEGGEAKCQCEICYHAEGLECVADPDPCQGVDCSGHGNCVWGPGCTAQCECETGYQAHMNMYCAPEQTGDGSLCSDDGWCLLGPQPTPGFIDGLWGTAADDVWMVGSQGKIVHFDGQNWSHLQSGIKSYLFEIFGLTADDIWAVGARGTIVHLDGETVLDMSIDQDGLFFNVWGSGPDDVWAVGGTVYTPEEYGGQGVVAHWDGSAWTLMDVPLATQCLTNVFGFGPDDVWMTGMGGLIIHFDGTEWSAVSSGTAVNLFEVWGSAPDDIWVVGQNSTVLHWDGNAWSLVTVPDLNAGATALWGSAADDVWIGTTQTAGPGRLYHFDGSVWTEHVMPVQTYGWQQVFNIWGASPDDLWVGGTIMFHWDGQSWEAFREKPDGWLHALWGAAHDDLWVGSRDALYHFDGTGFNQESLPLIVRSPEISDIWGESADDVWFSRLRDPSLLHWNGTELSAVSLGTNSSMYEIWGMDASDFWLAGTGGALYHYDGTDFTQADSGTTEALRGLWGAATDDVWAVGTQGTILHWDQSTWTLQDTGYNVNASDFEDVWGTGPDDVWVVGAYPGLALNPAVGQILHWDGDTWSRQEFEEFKSLRAVSGTGPDDVWVVGVVDPGTDGDNLLTSDDDSVVLHWDGVSWTVSPATRMFTSLFNVFAVGEHVFAIGPQGTVLHNGPALP